MGLLGYITHCPLRSPSSWINCPYRFNPVSAYWFWQWQAARTPRLFWFQLDCRIVKIMYFLEGGSILGKRLWKWAFQRCVNLYYRNKGQALIKAKISLLLKCHRPGAWLPTMTCPDTNFDQTTCEVASQRTPFYPHRFHTLGRDGLSVTLYSSFFLFLS